MHIHRFERFWVYLSLFLIVGFVGTVVFGFTVLDLKVVGDRGGTVDPTNLAETPFGQPGVRQVDENAYEVYMVARQFFFQPGSGQPLTLPAGSEVTFHITSPDVIHGIQVIGTNLNVMVIPGQVATFDTSFPDPGTFGIVCHEYCGPAHHTMEGLIEIVPPSEFNEDMLVQ